MIPTICASSYNFPADLPHRESPVQAVGPQKIPGGRLATDRSAASTGMRTAAAAGAGGPSPASNPMNGRPRSGNFTGISHQLAQNVEVLASQGLPPTAPGMRALQMF